MAVKKRRRAKPLLIFLIVTILLLIITCITWFVMCSPVNKESSAKIEVVIPNGTSARQIGGILKEKKLIRSEKFFYLYIKVKRVDSMKASTYTMSKDMSLEEIIKVLESGNSYNPDVIKITFKEGERITDFATAIANKTNHTYEEVIKVMQDKEYIKRLIDKNWFLTDEILNESIYYPLEGYLAPNTYDFTNKDVSIEVIIETMLKQTDKILIKYKEKITEKSTHYYITMASMAELEGTNTDNRKEIVSVFENRLAKNMNLGSDVTTYYALQLPMDKDLTTAQFSTVNPYNTRSTTMMGKMPIGAICNPSESSIEAALNPTTSTYLYFVADKYGKIHFTNSLAEHNSKVKEIKDKGDWIW